MSTIRIVHLDRHDLFREGISALLTGQSQIEVVGQAGKSQDALVVVTKEQPDIVLLELNLDCELNTDIIPDLLAVSPQTRVVLLTGIDEPEILQLAVQMGVMGILQKTVSSSVLVKAIQKVHAGEVWIDRTMMATVLTTLALGPDGGEPNAEKARIEALSNREMQVITLIGEGLKNKQIAERLSISETTVRHHLTSIYSKLEVSDRLELAIYAYRHELASLPE